MVTFLIATVLAVLFGLAIRYLVKHGTCDCGSKGGCSGSCSNCPHFFHSVDPTQKHQVN